MKYLFTYHALLKILWWARLESNQRHKDFQSFALPTELLALWYSHQDLNLKPSPCKGAALPLRHASIWCTLRVTLPASQRHWFYRPIHLFSGIRVHYKSILNILCATGGSRTLNPLRATDFESVAYANSATIAQSIFNYQNMVAALRFELKRINH